jgi:hypothetical protein
VRTQRNELAPAAGFPAARAAAIVAAMPTGRFLLGAVACGLGLAGGAGANVAQEFEFSGSTTITFPIEAQETDPLAALHGEAGNLVHRAINRVRERRESCRPATPETNAQMTRDTPDRAVLDVLAPLRRGSRAADRLDVVERLLLRSAGEAIYAAHIRQVAAMNGQRLVIVVVRSTPLPEHLPAPCLDAQRTELRTLSGAEPRDLRARALAQFRDYRRRQERINATPPTRRDQIFLLTRGGVVRGGGSSSTAASFMQAGILVGLGDGDPSRSWLHGLVPDGVARVTLQYRRRAARARGTVPTLYAETTRTVSVRQNVISVRVPRGIQDALPDRVVWRGADNAVLRVLTLPA